jgi:HD-GYP domain-containing protein (c-di-GMP phosphodiesterase class II)
MSDLCRYLYLWHEKGEKEFMRSYYRPLLVESIDVEDFPNVALYLKNGFSFVLYKSHDRKFTSNDRARLLYGNVEFLYVRSGDFEAINEYIERSLEGIMGNERLSFRSRGKILYQTSINYVNEIFDNPERVEDYRRCRRLIENLLTYISGCPDFLHSVHDIMSHNHQTYVHSVQVAALAIAMHSKTYLLARDELIDVGVGALLHDYGMVTVPAAILNKKGELTAGEYADVKRHSEEGYRYLKERTPIGEVSLSIVRYHHERCDGKGYPHGLREDEIPRSAHISGVCDVYCALTSDRAYREAFPPEESLQIMRQGGGGSLNPKLIGHLESIVCSNGAGQEAYLLSLG